MERDRRQFQRCASENEDYLMDIEEKAPVAFCQPRILAICRNKEAVSAKNGLDHRTGSHGNVTATARILC